MRPSPRNKANSARPWRSWYSTPEWHRIRGKRLKIEPWCRMCAEAGVRTRATVVDHVVPHRGNRALFFDFANTASLCKPHHDRDKQREEVLGYRTSIGADGLPTDPRHPFYR